VIPGSTRAHHSPTSIRAASTNSNAAKIRFSIRPGTRCAKRAPSGAVSTLAIYFTAFVFLMAVNMALDLKPKPSRQPPGAAGMFAAGTTIGGLSSLVAIGGAVMSVPFMIFCNVPIIQAVGTAAAIGIPIAVGGMIGYLYTGWNATGLPAWSVGYVYLPALVGITIASVLTAPLGARFAHRVPGRMLKRIFAALLFVLAARMLVGLW
jgi:uncharacterized protein